jgi:prepilin peptidase CpaA
LNETLQLVFASIFVVCAIYAIVSDIAALRIPNGVPIVLIASFAAYALLGRVSPLWPNVLIAAVIFLLMFISFAMGWVAAGDVKFFPALMIWAGPSHGAAFILLFALFSAAFALWLLGLKAVQRSYPAIAGWPVLGKMSRWARNGICPYGVPMGLAALCAAPSIFMLRP